MRRLRVAVPAVAAFAAAAAVDAPAAGAPAVVTVSMREWSFRMAPKTVPSGAVVIRVTNAGTIRHNFAIAGRRTRVLGPGATAVLRITFRRAGRKAFLCTLPSHAEAGMAGRLRVT